MSRPVIRGKGTPCRIPGEQSRIKRTVEQTQLVVHALQPCSAGFRCAAMEIGEEPAPGGNDA